MRNSLWLLADTIQELISRLDSRSLPLEPSQHCFSSMPSTCLWNDVLASRMQAAC